MKNRNIPRAPAQMKHLKAERRDGPTKRTAAKVARQIEIRRALSATDAAEATAAEDAVVDQCVSSYGRALDAMARPFRHPQYEHLSPLQATNLFAERYVVAMNDPDWPWSRDRAAVATGLPNASLAEISHFWEGRAQADILGMDYDRYISAVSVSHLGRGFDTPLRPKDLRGRPAMAVAAFADVLHREADEREAAVGT